MKPLWLALLMMLCFGAALPAQTVAVQSGDHDGFTRLVLTFGAPVDWRFGRTSDGYELHLAKPGPPFDLSQVFARIPHDRLSAIWVDPQSGNLRLGIGCLCYAIPFEFRPGVIVVDLREGPPPEGSSFETALDGASQPELVAQTAPRPRLRPKPSLPYNWQTAVTAPPEPQVLPLQNADLSAMQTSILHQMSEGAARGVVDMAAPKKTADDSAPIGPLRQIRIGEDLGFATSINHLPPKTLTEAGASCLTDDRLDISSWGAETPISEQIAPARTGLMTEFDVPDPVAIKRAIQFYLYIGFGAETLQLLPQMPKDEPDMAIWQTMAHIIDDGTAPDGPFAGMLNCDTAAAFWAVLARPKLTMGDTPNLPAVLRTFSGLPLHLRRYFGPILSERFLAIGDTATARALRDAILRAPGDPGPEVRLMAAELDIASGETEAGGETLHKLSTQTGPAATKALIAYVDEMVRKGATTEAQTVTTIDALLLENRGTDIEPALLRARLLALAASGDFDAAFAMLDTVPQTKPDLWQMLAMQGNDDAVLVHSMHADADLPLATRRQLATRLNTLGLPDQAQLWLSDITEDIAAAGDEDRILAAQIAMGRHDSQSALRLVAGLSAPTAVTLRANAQAQSGNLSGATGLFNALGDAEAELRTARTAQDWQMISEKDQGPWRDAAVLLTASPPVPADPATDGPLAQGKRVLDESTAARATLSALLAQVQSEAATN